MFCYFWLILQLLFQFAEPNNWYQTSHSVCWNCTGLDIGGFWTKFIVLSVVSGKNKQENYTNISSIGHELYVLIVFIGQKLGEDAFSSFIGQKQSKHFDWSITAQINSVQPRDVMSSTSDYVFLASNQYHKIKILVRKWKQSVNLRQFVSSALGFIFLNSLNKS